MSKIKLSQQGVFYTIQGEGYHAGEPSIFVRLAGCSVGCKQCDTDYRFHMVETVDRIIDQCAELRKRHGGRPEMVWVTGGEPTDQDIEPLRSRLWSAGFRPSLATSGVRNVEGLWWFLSVSPHAATFTQRIGSELKLVPRLNGLDVFRLDLSGAQFPYRYVQPMEGNQTSFDDCMKFLEANHSFRLTSQAHKAWGLP
jgi:organic radical activating enzyme